MTTSESTQRDELAQIITDHVHEGLLSYDACTPHAEIDEAADDILAAGYRKPRTITTVEELDALAASTRVWGSSHPQHGVPATGSPYEKQADGEWWDFGNQFDVGSDDIMLPALVIEAQA